MMQLKKVTVRQTGDASLGLGWMVHTQSVSQRAQEEITASNPRKDKREVRSPGAEGQ